MNDPFAPSKKLIGFGKEKENQDYFTQFKGLSFLEFNRKIGLPKKDGKDLELFDYEIGVCQYKGKKQLGFFGAIESKKMVWIKKATGLGLTEIILRWIAWKCCKNDKLKNRQIDVTAIIITGPNIDLSIRLMGRLKELFKDYTFTEKNTTAHINGCKIEAFPSHHLDAARGLNPKIVMLDEADFFPIGEQEDSRVIAERYIPKTKPYLIFVSTPSPDTNGLFAKMEKEEPSLYHKLLYGYELGVGKIYDPAFIELAKKSPTFEQEYNLQYGFGEGNIYPYHLLAKCTEEYDLKVGHGQKVLCVDPAYGSSMFGIVGFEKIDNLIYIKEAVQYHRPSPAAMLDIVTEKGRQFGGTVLVDSAHPGLIRDLKERGINAREVNFRTEMSNMVVESSQAVKELRARIHPCWNELLGQLRSVKFDDKGKPNKKEISFDLGDAFMMGCNYLKTANVKIIKV